MKKDARKLAKKAIDICQSMIDDKPNAAEKIYRLKKLAREINKNLVWKKIEK